ncbi:MAG: hypothetical protein PUC44_02315 [Eubacteriales bacterium]|nr:hypothetical protein [Eubacteriales bacterium]
MAEKRVRVPMPVSQRAKQFIPFAAVSGLEEALRAKERETELREEGNFRIVRPMVYKP